MHKMRFARRYIWELECLRNDCPKDNVYTWFEERCKLEAYDRGMFMLRTIGIDCEYYKNGDLNTVTITIEGAFAAELTTQSSPKGD